MMATKTIQRRLKALENEERFCKQQELDSLAYACYYAWRIVLAYYLGGLVSDDDKDLCNAEKWGSDGGTCKDLDGATARALKYSSTMDYYKRDLELCDRYIDAYHRLFAKIGFDFDATERDVLFDAFVTMVNQLPDDCLNWTPRSYSSWIESSAGTRC
jgi:hypothetical protein